MLVQELNGGERLVLGGRGEVAIHGEVGEKGDDLPFAEVAWVPGAVMPDEAFDPGDVGFFGAVAEVSEAQFRAEVLQECRFRLHWEGGASGTTHATPPARRRRHPFNAAANLPPVPRPYLRCRDA